MEDRPNFNRRQALHLFGLTALVGGATVACSTGTSGGQSTASGGQSTPGGAGNSGGGSSTAPAQSGGATASGGAPGAGCGGSISLGTNGDANNVNPILVVDSDGYWRTDLMFDALVDVDPEKLIATPRLAKSWDVSDDGRSYTFHLDERAKFWAGQPVTAADVAFTVMAMLSKDSTGPFQAYWKRLDGAEDVIAGTATSLPGLKVEDDHTITMVLTEPYAGFLTVMAHDLKSLPKHLLKDAGTLTTSSAFSQKPVGSGPFKFKSWVPGTSFEVEANTDYWAGPVCMGSMKQTIIPDMNTLSQGVVAGEFDATIVAPASELPGLAKKPNLQVFQVDSRSGEGWFFNLRKSPWKDNLKLRQAMAHGVDFMTYQKKFMYVDDPIPATFYEYASWAYDKDAGAVPVYDPDKAKALLEEAGYPGGKGLTFDVITNAGNQFREQAQVYIQAAMAELGVTVTISKFPWAQFIAQVQNGTFDTAVLSTTSAIPDPTAMDPALMTGGATNYSGYSNSELDDLLEQAGKELDQAKRKDLYRQVQQLCATELPYLPTAWYPNSLVINKKYGNVKPSVIHALWNLKDLTVTS
jgi:peptide/nickel transport system substrate-binding protein